MKPAFITSFSFLLFTLHVFSQNACPPPRGPSPVVAKPTETSIVSATCSTLVVKWKGNVGQNYKVEGTYQDLVTYNTNTSVSTNINCDANQNCTAAIPVVSGTIVTWSVAAQSVVSGISLTSYPAIGVLNYPIPSCIGGGVSLNCKAILEGPYNSSTGMMGNDLNTLGILQTHASSQPYNTNTFLYSGTERVEAGFYASHPDIVDWVLVELRNPNHPSSTIARKAAFVKQDGTIVGTSSTNTQLSFEGIAPGHYYVSIRHRNHLSILSNAPVDFTNGPAHYDFTTASHRSFKSQSYPSTVQVGTIWAMRAGNANANDELRYTGPGNDRAAILTSLGNELTTLTGYYLSDLNLNGQAKYHGPGNDRAFLLSVALSGNELLTRKQQPTW